jgi:hypothetical protein
VAEGIQRVALYVEVDVPVEGKYDAWNIAVHGVRAAGILPTTGLMARALAKRGQPAELPIAYVDTLSRAVGDGRIRIVPAEQVSDD